MSWELDFPFILQFYLMIDACMVQGNKRAMRHTRHFGVHLKDVLGDAGYPLRD